MKSEEKQGNKKAFIKRKRRLRIGRRVKIAAATVLISLALIGLLGLSILKDVNTVSASLLGAKNNLLEGYRLSQDLDLSGAKRKLNDAERNFIQARRVLTRPAFRIAALIPGVGNNVYAVNQLAASGSEATRAGLKLLDAAAVFSRGKDGIDIEYSNSRLNLDPFAKTLPHVKKARIYAMIALAEEEKITRNALFPQVKEVLDDYSEKITELNTMVNNTEQILEVVPAFFGANGKRRYFMAVQNNAELRATGGLIGNYGVVEADGGKLSMVKFDEIHALQKKDQPRVIVADDFNDRYDRFSSTKMWINSNMSPDFPAVSKVLLQLYKSSTGAGIDGIIAIDPIGLKYLLEAIGAVDVPGEDVKISSENVVDWTLVEAYKKYQQRDERKDFLKDVAVAVWQRIIAGQFTDRSLLVKKVVEALSDKHMIIYSTYAQEERVFRELGYAGVLNENKGDYLQVVVQNHGGNKVDFYLDQKINYKVNIHPDGSLQSIVDITLINNTPKTGLPTYVTGEHHLGAKGGQNNAYVSVYAPDKSSLLECTYDGAPGDPEVGQEKDKAVFSHYMYVPAGEERKLTLVYDNAYNLPFGQGAIAYLLDWQVQPVIRKPSSSLNIRYPANYKAAKVSEDMALKNNEVFMNQVLQKDLKLEVQLEEKDSSRIESFKKWLKNPML